MLFLMLFFVVLCSPWFFSPWYYCSQWFSLCVFFSIIIIIIIPIGVPSRVPHDGSQLFSLCVCSHYFSNSCCFCPNDVPFFTLFFQVPMHRSNHVPCMFPWCSPCVPLPPPPLSPIKCLFPTSFVLSSCSSSSPCVFPQCCSFEFHHVTWRMMMMMMFPIMFPMCSQYVPNMFFFLFPHTYPKFFPLFNSHGLYRPNENVFNTSFLLLIFFFFCIFWSENIILTHKKIHFFYVSKWIFEKRKWP